LEFIIKGDKLSKGNLSFLEWNIKREHNKFNSKPPKELDAFEAS